MKWQLVLGLTLMVLTCASVLVFAQPTAPADVNGCVYNAVLPTLTDKQSRVFQCDSSGRFIVTVN